MWELISTYKYLSVVALGLGPVALAYYLSPDQKCMMCLSGSLLCLMMPGVVIYEGEYWSPTRLLPGAPGVEDFLLGFSIGSLTWLAMIWPSRNQAYLRLVWTTFLSRFLLMTAASTLGIALLTSYLHLSAIVATILTQFAIVGVIFWMRPAYQPLFWQAVLIFVPYYFLGHFLASQVIPDYGAMWTGVPILGLTWQGLPIIDELLWIISFMSYPLVLAFAADLNFTRPYPTKSSGRSPRGAG